jgi:hypothetical protein
MDTLTIFTSDVCLVGQFMQTHTIWNVKGPRDSEHKLDS